MTIAPADASDTDAMLALRNHYIAHSFATFDEAPLTLAAVQPAASSNDRTTRRLYDKAGRLAETIDGSGYVTEYAYDGANQLIGTTALATALTSAQLTALAAETTEVEAEEVPQA